MLFNVFTTFVLLASVSNVKCSLQGEEVSIWADAIGKDLWMLGKTITHYEVIKQKYKFFNAKVGEKDPRTLLAEVKDNISRMIDRKMDAIKCIQQKAEEVAEAFLFNKSAPYQYYSSKWSSIIGKPPMKMPKSLIGNKNMYLLMKLNNDTHFYNLPVNTSHSSVHVPTNVYDKEDAAAFAIQWSEALDEVFIRNYNSDPALSWQYFGSSSGIMRHYPAQRWEDHKKDLFDCRIRTWFIEAATCTKDAIILIDNSGSMTGMGHHIGSMTASSILDTFSNNDFINVLNYSSTTNYTIPCFGNMLVQATRENIAMFRKAIELMKPEGKTNLGQALEVAFGLLKHYREIRGCSENSTNCNQAIMIITDGVNSNMSDIVIKHNYLNNGSNIPVRIFTYLVGKEVVNAKEVKWISCANRGYYTPVQTLEQVTVSVLQYINVVARPLVLQADTGGEHPVSWTHAYIDITYDDKNDKQINEPYRLLTSVAVPCYDTKINKMNDTRTAYLLGVAGTDVPLDEFNKMTLPYKIGVNGYSFIVSNNGYVLMHPDLRPVFEGILKDNYNSIDLTQVEQHDDQLPARVIGKTLENLRQALVDGKEGSLHNIKLSYHYDGMKRISEEYFDYYYTPLEGTPFTIGIALPNKYGNYSLEVGDEIQRNRHTDEDLTLFFQGNKWKIHPKWVYCKYHYLEGHEFDTPEKEWSHFLGKMYDRNFRWERQYEEDMNDLDEVVCGRNTLEDDDYYCDKQLVQRLIFDARNTYEIYSENWKFNTGEMPLFKRFNASLRFVATMSGLTRWDYIFNNSNTDPKSKKKEFGDLHPRAINEKWYKSAVLQHQYDKESFVYSVPFDSGSTDADPLVTGSYAIFPSDRGLEAPGSVVGFQFSQTKLRDRFQEISTKLSNQCAYSRCGKCDETLTCYIVDSSGYIIVSSDHNDTGRFFGEVEGDILNSMLKEKIFKEVTIFDYQALCKIDEDQDSAGPNLITPFKYAGMVVSWIFFKIVYFIMEINVYSILEQATVYAQDVLPDGDEDPLIMDDDDETEDSAQTSNKDDYYACEKEINLYVLQQDLFIKENFHGEINKPGIRNYYVKRIRFSNLIFVAVNNTLDKNEDLYYSTAPFQITEEPVFDINYMNTTLLPCKKLDLNNLPRRRLTGCYNEHPLEHEIVDCGRADYTKMNSVLLLVTLCVKFYL